MLLMNWVNYIFVHQDAHYAQNHKLRIEVNVLIIRATSCTLRGVNKKRPSHHECDGRLIYFLIQRLAVRQTIML